jgi:hypothetical protein
MTKKQTQCPCKTCKDFKECKTPLNFLTGFYTCYHKKEWIENMVARSEPHTKHVFCDGNCSACKM